MAGKIVQEELDHLARTRRLLEEVPYEIPPREKDIVEELTRLRDEMANAKAEDKGALMAQYDRQFNLLGQLREARDKETVDPDSPYFAHLALEEEGEVRHVFLGKATRLDHGLRVVDWRNAPISRLFYGYQEGEIFEERFGGRDREGEVRARRTLTVQKGQLLRIDGAESTYFLDDDGSWQLLDREAPRLVGGQGASKPKLRKATGARGRLGRSKGRGSRRARADKRLPDIAGLIDPDQFELISRPSGGFVVVRGTAGSGKTTVALHRIAYLAYHDPQIDSGQSLFLVFSRALRDYVGHVLPQLGLKRVKPRTFPEWAKHQLRHHFKALPKSFRSTTPEVVSRLKSHPALMIALERQVERQSGPATWEQAMDDWASVITLPEGISSVLRELAPDAFTPAELDRAIVWCRDRYEDLLSWLDDKEEGEGLLDPEDVSLLLRAWQLRVGPLRFRGQRPLTYRHIAIDEVQDFSPVDVRVLLDCLDARQSITLAGDTQQHVMANAGFTSWADFFRWLGVKGAAVDTLRVAYRSARPIVTFAQDVLGPLREDDTPPLTVRSGPDVEVLSFTDHGAVVAFLADALKALHRDEPMANVALIAPDGAVASLYYDGLQRAQVPQLRRVVGDAFTFKPGVEIVGVRDVKGLEFDYVVVLEASAAYYPDKPGARRLLHVAATRAIHQLWLTHVGAVSPVVRQATASEEGDEG